MSTPGPSSSTPTPLEVGLATIEPTWRIALRVWWSWQWRVFIAGFLLDLFVSFWIGAIGGAVGLHYRGALVARQISNVVVFTAVGLYFFKDVLDREFKGFRVCVLPKR